MVTTIDVLEALAAGDWDGAAERAAVAGADDPGSQLALALDRFLGDLPAPGVYEAPSAFEAFISNGGNVVLYERAIAALAALHADEQPETVLDIGCGDGRVTAAVLGPSTARVDLVEPSAELLVAARAAVSAPGTVGGREVVGHQAGVTEVLAGLDADVRWDLVQSTFALHATHPDERPALFAALADRTDRLVVVDFDVPAFEDRSPEHLAYLAERYERGVREYVDHPEVVTGFLLPVLVGQLDPSRPRYTFEQPTAAWAELVEAAGFTVEVEPVSPYWWADATLLSATRRA
ncbi:class I SAM-dependent methyltransferase [Aquihabitans sp. G128]|uniref:class I SAM-dependent methyltransferase n=1 Tax=Aquihabitans sp. G128 TaxID=2849779 RepID=UPI001C21B0D4|nr:class I SAM-dependent methyltransferase [Aquihabitans sp. G128]QXC60795.1 class I SAM-dependent methyltransferase [Aquihabitans sp. G128]